MLHIEIVCIGKLKQQYLRDGCAEYIKMLTPYVKVDVTELAESNLPDKDADAAARIVNEESERIWNYLSRKRAYFVSLCIDGKQATSPDVARLLRDTAQTYSHIIFIIGGSYGLSEELIKKTYMRLSMSKLTFPHQLARLILLEQLYRACSINANGKYHK